MNIHFSTKADARDREVLSENITHASIQDQHRITADDILRAIGRYCRGR
jgi:hypothetical protein